MRVTLTPLTKALYKELYRKSFYEFVKAFWSTCDPAPFIDGKLIQFYCEIFQYFCLPWCRKTRIYLKEPKDEDFTPGANVIDVRGTCHNLCLNVPPRHSKSMIFNVLGPCWLWLNDAVKVASISHTQSLAGKMNEKRYNVINSALFQTLYRDEIRIVVNQKSYICDQRGAELYSLNRNAMTGYGADVIVNDDLTNAETARKDMGEMLNAWSYYQNTMPSRINNPNKCFIMNIQQRLAVNDITGMIQQNAALASTYKFVVLPAIFERDTDLVCPISGTVIHYKKGEGLWPERFHNYKALMVEVGPTVFETQYMQHPMAKDDAIVRESMIIKKPVTEVPPMSSADVVYASHDFPVKDKKESDFLGSVIGYRSGGTLYITDCMEEHKAFTASVDYVCALNDRHPGIIQIIEDKANGSPILQQLQDVVPGMQAYNPGTSSKTQRLESATLYMRSKNVVFVMDEKDGDGHYRLSANLENLVNRLLMFPLVAHDDIVDAFDMLVNFVFLDKRFSVYARDFSPDESVFSATEAQKKLQSDVFVNRSGDLWKCSLIAIEYAEQSKLYVMSELQYKGSMDDALRKIKEWSGRSFFIDTSITDSLSGTYTDGIAFEHYGVPDFDVSVANLKLAFSKRRVFVERGCSLTRNDIETFKYGASKDEQIRTFRTVRDGFVGNIRVAMRYYGGIV